MGGNGPLGNPLNALLNDYDRNNMTRFMGAINAKYDIYDGLYAKQTFSYDYTDIKSSAWWAPNSPNGYPIGIMQKVNSEKINLISKTQLGYGKTFNQLHNFDILASYEIEKYDYNELYVAGLEYANPDKNEIQNAASTEGESSYKQRRMISYLLYANYNYDNKYYVSANYRRDGSSQFSRDARWGDFWSVSGAWRFSQESFMQPVSDIITDAKLRLSYGLNGNLPIDFYEFFPGYKFGNKYNGTNGVAEARLAYKELSWEKNYNFNVGLDLNFLNRFSLSFEFYNRDSEDLLIDRMISQTTGFATTFMNVGSMNNKGVELTLESVNVQNSDFFWKTSFNIAHNSNKITKLDGINDEMSFESSVMRAKIGKDFNTFYVYEYAGVDPTTGKESFYTNSPDNPREITTDISQAKQVFLDKVSPTVQGGLTNTFNYKGIDLGFTFTYSLGGHFYDMGDVNFYGASGGTDLYDGAVPSYYKMEDIWQKEGDIAKIPNFVYGNTTERSSRYIKSTDHLRLKNITLGYSLPKNVLKSIDLSNVRVYASAVNLFTVKRSNVDVDPELPVNQTYGARTYGTVSYSMPPLKTITFGVEVTF